MISECNCGNCKNMYCSYGGIKCCSEADGGYRSYIKDTDYCKNWESKEDATPKNCGDCKFLGKKLMFGKYECNRDKKLTAKHYVCPYWQGKEDMSFDTETNVDNESMRKIVKEATENETQFVEPELLVNLHQMIKDLQKVNLRLTERVQKLEKENEETQQYMVGGGDIRHINERIHKLEDSVGKLQERAEVLDSRTETVEPLKDWHEGKWIAHRTLRKQNKETYVGWDRHSSYRVILYGDFLGTTYNKNKAFRYNNELDAITVRDMLNKDRVGKRYLWVISKVEE